MLFDESAQLQKRGQKLPLLLHSHGHAVAHTRHTGRGRVRGGRRTHRDTAVCCTSLGVAAGCRSSLLCAAPLLCLCLLLLLTSSSLTGSAILLCGTFAHRSARKFVDIATVRLPTEGRRDGGTRRNGERKKNKKTKRKRASPKPWAREISIELA